MADAVEIREGIEILYPPDHGVIELAVLRRDGTLQSGHFDDRSKLIEEILKYDSQSDTLAIYTGLNQIKNETFTRPEDPLNITNKVSRQRRSKGGDIDRVTGILFDIDPFRIGGDRKDSTTDEEHADGIEAAQYLENRLSLMGWPEPVVGDSGNGGQLRYITDLPASDETSSLIKRLLEAANSILPENLRGKVEVDTATHDLPRVSKVFGTISRKGPGTDERPHRRSAIISKPDNLQLVQIDSIMKLIEAGKPKEKETATTETSGKENGTKPLSMVQDDPAIRQCLKNIVLNKNIKRLEEVSAHEHKGRVAIATELLYAGYSDEALAR